MPNYQGQACAKIILTGEHAVVYGRPGIALPLPQLQATAQLTTTDDSVDELIINAPQIALCAPLNDLSVENPLAAAVWQTSMTLNTPLPIGGTLTIDSNIPIASGLGSGAAVSIAIARCLAHAAERTLLPTVSAAIAHQVERLQHGTPSGIDTTVIAYQQPIYFQREHAPQSFTLKQPLHLVIANSGIVSPTKIAVEAVRELWQSEPSTYDGIFHAIGELSQQALLCLQNGEMPALGAICNANHYYLQQLGVSHSKIEQLIQASLQAGAYGAKIVGAGMGGNMLAIVSAQTQAAVLAAIQSAGAAQSWAVTLGG